MGRVAVVTGGSRGIGAATVAVLRRAGHDVVFSYRQDERAAHAVAEGTGAVGIRADVADEHDVRRLFALSDEVGELGVLVNNAGIVGTKTRVDELDVARIERMLAVNVVGPFLCAREGVLRMSTRHGGAGGVIVNVGSVAARLASGGQYVDYAASKAALDTMTLGLAHEVADEGIRVNCLRPGIIDTSSADRQGFAADQRRYLATLPACAAHARSPRAVARARSVARLHGGGRRSFALRKERR